MLVHRGLLRTVAGSSHVVTIGNFDGVHLGHQAILRELREASLRLGIPSCVVSFEPHPREFFAPQAAPPRLTSLREKCALLAEHGVARMQVCRFDQAFSRLTADQFIDSVLVQGLGTRWLMIGEDFRFGAKRGGDFTTLQSAGTAAGFEVHAMPTVVSGAVPGEPARVSSSALRETLAAGNVEQAQALLDRPYSISGRVMHGDKIGRTLGFPTANVHLRHKRPLATGIYAVHVFGLGETQLNAVASLGVRPTVTNSNEMRLEVFILDFSEQIYGRRVRVDFLRKLRDEEKYEDLDTLKGQIARDCDAARIYFSRA